MDPARESQDNSSAGRPEDPDRLTVLLNAAGAGDAEALQVAMNTIQGELRAIAQAKMNHERPGHTLQATALVNEAYLRLLGKHGMEWEGRKHFFRAAAEAMRKILIDHARARNAAKRGGGDGTAAGAGGTGGAGRARLPSGVGGRAGGRAALSISSVADLASEPDPDGILALDEAIVRLESVDAQAASVVRLRFYAGLNEVCVAEALNISERTVRRTWAFARGWLRDAIERETR